MRRILQCAFAATFITSAIQLDGAPRPATREPNQATAASQMSPDLARMEAIVQSYVSEKKFMGCVLLARGSNVLLDKGYGFANLEWEIPNSPSAKFRLGSVTKQFTAASFLLLQERGKLKVTDPVKKYMPDAPAAWDKITIFNLLTHSSGIPNFTSFPDYASQEPFDTTPEKLVARFRDKPLDFQPGEKMSYSNSGYVLLGYLIEKISGESYEKFVQEEHFHAARHEGFGIRFKFGNYPASRSRIRPKPERSNQCGLYQHDCSVVRWRTVLHHGGPAEMGAGSVRRKSCFSPSSLQEMTTPFKNDYAFGLLVHNANGRKVIDHSGGAKASIPRSPTTLTISLRWSCSAI